MKNDRATLRGKPLDEDCKKARISKHEYGMEDERCFCYGLYAPNSIYELHPKCVECSAYCLNAKPPKETVEVDCRKCLNCTGYSCKAYDTDNPDIAVNKCAGDGFKNYVHY